MYEWTYIQIDINPQEFIRGSCKVLYESGGSYVTGDFCTEPLRMTNDGNFTHLSYLQNSNGQNPSTPVNITPTC